MLRLVRLGIKVYWPAVWSRVAYGVSREQRAFTWVMQNSKEGERCLSAGVLPSDSLAAGHTLLVLCSAGDPESVLAALDKYGQNVSLMRCQRGLAHPVHTM